MMKFAMRAQYPFLGVTSLAAFVLLTVMAVSRPARASAPVIVQYNVMVPMRDGVRLATDIHRPAKAGRYPAILVRDPYENGTEARWMAAGRMWAEHGYVFVFQNVRGREDSEGSFYPYLAEANDGYDTDQWLARQPWSNGKVGTIGQSYDATVQWLSAPLRSPALAAIAPRMTPFDYYSDVDYVGGALSLGTRIWWAALVGGRTTQSAPLDWPTLIWHLPLDTFDRALGMNLPHWRDWIAHPSYDDYWRPVNMEARLTDMDVPAFSVGGWYDVFLRGTLSSYTGMRKYARSRRARDGQRLLIGPWPHTSRPTARLGDLDFGPASVLTFDTLYLPWFDHWLKGENAAYQKEAPVRIFIMGENRWRSESEWPLARTHYTNYYFRGDGRANGLGGDGKLETQAPGASEPPDHYAYDPRVPVPTVGGSLMFPMTPPGPFDQSKVEARQDVLVFTSASLATDTEVTGPLTVTLYAASSAVDTDFTAKLTDVYPDGKSYNLQDGIIRARYRESIRKPTLIEPGRVYQYTIDLWATSNLFKRGHRIRVDISSSNFPRFDRNPDTGHEFGADDRLQIARQTILHSRRYPSHITLPIIPR
jgi:putative CocE/NonD family hydrolase